MSSPILRATAIGVLCLAGLALGPRPAPGAQAEPPGPGEVIGYAEADRSGASQIWALPVDQPYHYVPTLPAHLGGKLAAVDTGPGVGVALFRGPYFTSRDQGCQPVLGTIAEPHLSWLGATARFAPAPPEQPDAEDPAGPSGTYASLILYRADLGPPPGALLLERRMTVGLGCTSPVHATVYNRIFVPVAEAPKADLCFELVGNYPGAPEPFALDFLNSDRIVLLMPGDMSARYADVRHDIRVQLFDGLSCEGDTMTLYSRAEDRRDLRLVKEGFRARARSIRVTYTGGDARALLARRQEAPAAQAPTVKTAPVKAAPVKAAPVKAAPEPIPDPTPTPATPRAKPRDAGPSLAAIKSPAAGADKGPRAVPVRATAQPTVASVPSRASEAKIGPALDEPPRLGAAPPADGLGDYKTAAIAALPAAKDLTPAGAKTFDFPVQDIYRLNHCLRWQKDCGEAAAAAWCQARGFARAVDWTVDKGIGATFPTFVLGEKKVCAEATCDGFKEITCGP